MNSFPADLHADRDVCVYTSSMWCTALHWTGLDCIQRLENFLELRRAAQLGVQLQELAERELLLADLLVLCIQSIDRSISGYRSVLTAPSSLEYRIASASPHSRSFWCFPPER